jgi:uncharacterized protein (TIRG00374 family)
MRKLIFIVILFFGAALVFLSFGELESIAETLRRGHLGFTLLAILFQLAWLVVTGFNYLSLYRVLGMNGTIFKMSLMTAAANFVNTVMPSAGMGGIAVFVNDAARSGQSPGKVTVVSVLFVFLDYLAFLCVLGLGLIVLFRRNDLDPSEITASLIMLSIAACLGFLLYLGSKSADALGNALAGMARFVNRFTRPFLHREYLSEARAQEFAHEIAADLQALPGRWASLIQPFLLALAGKTLMMGILTLSFLTFEVPFSTGVIVGGFSIAYLFLIVSPTPAGIGIVEGIMPLALSSLKVQWSQAVIITLAYRAVTFWFPLGIGAIALRHITRESKQ